MTNDVTLLLHVIEVMPATDDEKLFLQHDLRANGWTEQWQKLFGDILMKGVVALGVEFEKVEKEYDTAVTQVDTAFKEKMKTLEANTQASLKTLDRTDLAGREEIWDVHYDEVDKLYATYEEDVKKVFSTLALAKIKEKK